MDFYSDDKMQNITQETITSKVIRCLREDILSGRIPEGAHIGVKDISERYGVSNMPVREAFFTLAAEKLIEMSPYKGATVLPINERFILDMYEIQEMLERLLANGAMQFLTKEDFTKMREINRRIYSLEDTDFGREEYIRLNAKIHDIIYSHSPNIHAFERYQYYHQLFTVMWSNYERVHQRMVDAADEHLEIIEALESGDEDKVRHAIKIHSINARRNFLAQRGLKVSESELDGALDE